MRRHFLSKLCQRASLDLLKASNRQSRSTYFKYFRTLEHEKSFRGTHALFATGLFSAAALAGAAAYDFELRQAECAAELPLPSANPKAEQFVDEFRHWLQRIGGDTSAIEIKPSQTNPEAGLAVYTSVPEMEERLHQSWWQRLYSWAIPPKDFVIARVPLDHVVTVKTVIADEKLGPLYKELLSAGMVDERQLIMLFLLIERIRGIESAWYPWINILPQAFNTPIHYGKAELAELEGTTLYTATQVLKDSLRQQWAQLQPAASELLKAVGPSIQGFSPTFSDFLWAYSVFWSRSITFPDPQACPDNKSTLVEPREGIIPGIDFCNHDPEALCRWSIWNSAGSKREGQADSVSLLTSHRGQLKPGKEITINYGDKSNEELLHLYGFTLENNPNDALMIVCPPPQDQPKDFATKARLLLSQGLPPQIFLTSSGLKQDKPNQKQGPKEMAGLSDAAWDTLEILTMDAEQAETAEQSLAELSQEQLQRFKVQTQGLNPVQESAKVVAQLTSLQHLLERKLNELEGEDGGTTLEQDIMILEAADESVTPLLKSCVIYRASQKRLARSYMSRISQALELERRKLLALQKQTLKG